MFCRLRRRLMILSLLVVKQYGWLHMTDKQLLSRAHRELLDVLNSINQDKIHHDGDAFHELLNDIEKTLAEHAMRETQRLGQEIEQEPVCPDCKAEVLYECVACSSNNYPPKETT